MELPKAYDPKGAEGRWYKYWEERGYFHAEVNKAKPPFSIVIPPPNITGELHIGHALNNTLQDIIIRYKRMDGYEACWFPGMDHASIATHYVIEKGLAERELDDLLKKIGYPLPEDDRKLTRQDLGREWFVKLGWAWKEKYGGKIREQLKALGASCDWTRERFTLDEGLSNAVKEVFVRLYEEGFIYRDKYIINWCPRCQTALSDIEVEHEEEEGQLYYIKYPLADLSNTTAASKLKFITVATTRPETMLGDTAVAANPQDERYKDLIGKTAILPLMDRKIPIIRDDAVDPRFGTGLVKVTPAHDPIDFEIAKRHKLQQINILNLNATMNENAGKYAGLDRYECRERVLEDLKKLRLLERIENHVYALGHCQRCHTVVEPIISTQWFMKMEELAKPAIEAVRSGKIELIPKRWEHIYFNWMNNIKPWCISRQLWWGHRIPAWHCQDCLEITVSRDIPNECAACGSENIKQDEDVLDTWFSSALWPFSVMGWPQETPELRYFYPTQLLSTGHDIIFFWVARMIMMGLHFRRGIPFKQVFLHPLIKDEAGQKMSKSKGNIIDPLEMKEKYGMDALRFTLAASCSKAKEIRLSLKDLEGTRKFLNKIWNAARFVLMNLEEALEGLSLESLNLELEDRWILSRMTKALENLRSNLDSYDFNLAAAGLYNFIWHDFCDWYLEMIKPRLYSGDGAAKRSAQYVLQLVLKNILKMLHPFMPFITEEIWQRLPDREAESIMIAKFPEVDKKLIDSEAEKNLKNLQGLITAIRTIRSELNVPPDKKAKVLIKAEDKGIKALVEGYQIFFTELAQASEILVGAEIERPKQAPRKVLDVAEVFVPLEGLIDIRQEAKRLRKELEQARREFDSSSRKLNNEEFLEKAPNEVIEKEKRKLEEFREKIEHLEKNLEILGVKT